MKKFLFAALIALTGLAQQVFASDVVNNTSCDVKVTALVYNTSTCGIVLTCMSITVPAHSTAPLPICVPGASELIGYDVCWSNVICASVPCVSIGSSTGPYPCAQYPAGPVFLPVCDGCSPSVAPVKVSWVFVSTGGADLVIG